MSKLATKSDPPKRSLTSFFFFNIETVKKLGEKNPDLKQKEKFIKSGEVWK